MSDFALPQFLSISDVKRHAMPAHRRTTIHGSTSQNIYGPGEQVYLPLSTGTAGAFWDPETARLDMTVNIYNKNYFIDFINLPRCGFHCLIEECGVEFHNSLHDNNRFYAETIEAEMIRTGENMCPYEMTVSNPYEVGGGVAGEMHINLIKPSMVTLAGLPHGVQYPVLTQPGGNASIANTITEGILFNSHNYLKKPMGRNGYGVIDPFEVSTGQFSAGFVGETNGNDLYKQFGWWAETSLPTASTYDDRIPKTHVEGYLARNDYTDPGTSSDYRTYGLKNTAMLNNSMVAPGGSSYGLDLQILHTNRFYGTASYGGRYSKVFPRVLGYGSDLSDNSMWDVDYGQTVGGTTPMMWPYKQPCDIHELMKIRKLQLKGVNTQNVTNYYANCKNISIAIPVTLGNGGKGAETIWGNTECPLPTMSDSTRGHKYSFRVTLKVYNCLFGVYQKKWFPSLLFGAGRVRMRFRLQQPNIAFQTLMDPCRVVPHTARDKYPYQGVFKCGIDPTTSNAVSVENLDKGAINQLAHAVHPILITNYVPGACFNDMVAMGRFPVPQQRMKAMNRPMDLFVTRNRRYLLTDGGSDTLTGGDEDNDTIVDQRPATEASVDALNYVTMPSRTPNVFDNPFKTSGGEDIEIGRFDILSLCPPHSLPTQKNTSNYCYKTRGAADMMSSAYNPGTMGGNDLTALEYEQLWTTQRFEMVHKVLSDIIFEFSRNVHYGYPPHPIKTGINHTPVQNAIDPGLNTLLAVTDHDITLTPTSPTFSFQNYYYNTDWTCLFTDYLRQNVGGGNSGFNYSAGDVGTSQKVFHSKQDSGEAMPTDFAGNALNWECFNYPLPQYIPTRNPWDKRQTRVLVEADFLNENQLCYGTFLKKSVAQVRRSGSALYPLGSDPAYYPNINERLTYTVSDISFRVEEIILPEAASMQIIASAMEGGITMETRTVKVIEQIMQKQDLVKQILNVSAGICDDICFLFQPTKMLQGDECYGYNSYTFYNPWTSFKFIKQTTGTIDVFSSTHVKSAPNSEEEYNYLGGEPSYYNQLSLANHIGINTYISIGTETFPRQPINDLQTLLDHITWGDQRQGRLEYLGLDPVLHNTYDAGNFQQVLPFQDGFFSVFTPVQALDDQTITDNPHYTPLECNIQRLIRGKRAKQPALPFFKPLEGTFHLTFNLQQFMGQHDKMHVGTPMVNNNSYLYMENCHLFREWETRMLVITRVFARIVIERGGILQIFT